MAGLGDRDTERLQKIGRLNQMNLDEFVLALRPLLLSDGYFEETVDKMITRARFEITEGNLRRLGLRLFSKWHCAMARKEV